jgi:hypothetical protein
MGIGWIPWLEERTTFPFHGLWARKFMSLRRFKGIMSVLHIGDHTTEKDWQDDKLKKVWCLVDSMQARCLDLAQPDQHISIDKCMVKAQGCFGFK